MRRSITLAAVVTALLTAHPTAQVPAASGAVERTAIGQPLMDRQLPPGVLIVRMVEGDFVRNVVGQEVEVRSAGGGVDRARTGTDGRAVFDRLPPGVRVQVVALMAAETLKSEEFVVPTRSGARILLTAGDGAAAAVVGPQDRTVWFIARILGTVTILVFAAIVWRSRRARPTAKPAARG